MAIAISRRWMLIGLGALATLALIMFAPEEEQATPPRAAAPVAARTVASQASTAVGAASGSAYTLRMRSQNWQQANDLFESKSWYVPPPPPAPPPFPFSYMGSFTAAAGEGPTLFLVRGETLYSVKVGEFIEKEYRIDAFASGELTVTYLPLNMQQIISVGSKR